MSKILTNNIETVVLSGAVERVVLPIDYKWVWVRNDGGTTFYISKISNVGDGACGTIPIASRDSARLYIDGTDFYITGSGPALVYAANTEHCPFRNAPTFDGGVMAEGNPVQLDGLQGGVPFSEMVVRGKNLLKYPYYTTTKTINGVTFTDNGDGTITANGTATAMASFALIWKNIRLPKGTYTISGCPENGNVNTGFFAVCGTDTVRFATDTGNGGTFTISEDTNDFTFSLRIHSGVTVDNIVFRPQLELGSTPTAYEPPITGRDLTVNVCGKNLFDYRISAIPTGITVTTLDDGSLKVSGKMERESVWGINLIAKSPLPKGETYTLSINPDVIGILPISVYYIGSAKEKQTFIWNRDDYFTVSLNIQPNVDYDFIFRPQLELGSTATPYEPYNGSVTTITPTSNPYIIPNDIRQQDGLNNISVSAGEISVTGVRKNAAVKKIWDKLDELTTAIIVSNGETE